MSNPNLKENWTTLGLSLLVILAVLCWPVTLVIGGIWLLTKLFGIHL